MGGIDVSKRKEGHKSNQVNNLNKKKNPLKIILIIGLFLFFLTAPIILLFKLGVFNYFGNFETFNGKNNNSLLGKAEFKEVTQAELVETKTWGEIPLNQIIVVLDDDEEKLIKEIASDLNGEITGQMEYINLYQISFEALEESEFNDVLDNIQNTKGVETAFPNSVNVSKEIKGTHCSPLRDPVFEDPENSRAYEMIGMKEAWSILKASNVKLSEVQVGVLDDAIYNGSSEFGGKAKLIGDHTENPEQNDEGEIIDGGLNHGTMVTHVIGANSEDGGVTGIASILEGNLSIYVKNLYDGVALDSPEQPDPNNPAQVIRENKTVTIKSLVYLQKQVEAGAKVINCSYGPKKPDPQNEWVNKAYRKFFEKMAKEHPDVIFIAAAGNEGKVDGAITGSNYYPAGINLPNIVTVGALNNDGTKANFSNFASGNGEVTLSAPGVEMVLGVDENGQPIKSSGTSFAAPQVSATAALLKSINPKLTAEQIKDYLVKSAQPGTINEDTSTLIPEGMGSGLLRVDNAVLAVINDMRKDKGLEPLDKDSLINMSLVNLTAKGGGSKFELTAILPEIANGRAEVTITVNGQHIMKGDSTQIVEPNEEATWEIEIADPSVFVRVVRNDTGTCAYINLDEGIYEGEWDVTLTVTEDTLIPLILEDIGQSLEELGDEMGCEVSDSTEGGEAAKSLIGMTNDLYFTIVKENEAGTDYTLHLQQKNPEEEGLDISEMADNIHGSPQKDGSLLFEYSMSEDGVTAYITFTAQLIGENEIQGTFKLGLVGNSGHVQYTEDAVLGASWEGTRVE